MHEITVATYNVFGAPFAGQNIKKTFLRTRVKKRLRIIGELLNTSTIDVLQFQEVLFYPQLLILKRQLSNYPYLCFEPFVYGPKGGVVTFSKMPIEKVTYLGFKNTGTFWNKSIVAKVGKRGILIARLKGQPLYLFNTHLTQNSDHDWSEENRYVRILKSQLIDVTHAAKKYNDDSTSIVIAGDFNMPKTSEYYKEFITQPHMHDAFTDETHPTYIEEYAKDPRSSIREDYIFVSSKQTVAFPNKEHIFADKYTFEDGTSLYLSDHIGLKASIQIGK